MSEDTPTSNPNDQYIPILDEHDEIIWVHPDEYYEHYYRVWGAENENPQGEQEAA